MKIPSRLAYLGRCHHDASTTGFIVFLAVLRFSVIYEMHLFKTRGTVGNRSYFFTKEEVKGIELLPGVQLVASTEGAGRGDDSYSSNLTLMKTYLLV